MMTKRGQRLGIKYLRISDDREGTEAGVGRQSADLDALGERDNIIWMGTFCDDDRGASIHSTKPRPDYNDMIRRAKAGEFDGYVIGAWTSGRITRRPREREDLIDLAMEHGVTFVYAKSPAFDLNTADGRFVARVLADNDAAESDRISERVKAQTRERAHLGKAHGGKRRYGFPCSCKNQEPESHTHPDPEQVAAEAKVVRMLVERAAAGATLRGLAGELNAKGTPTPRGAGIWEGRVIKDLILRPANVGLAVHKGELIYGPGEPLLGPDGQPTLDEAGNPILGRGKPIRTLMPGIEGLTEDTWHAARLTLTDPARGEYHGRAPAALLSGIARCRCGGRVVRSARGYRGAACMHINRNQRNADAVVIGWVVTELGHLGVRPQPAQGAEVDNAAKIAVVERQVERLTTLLVDERISDAEYDRQKARKLAELDTLRRAEVVAKKPNVLHGVTPESWAELPLERRRQVVKELCEVRFVAITAANPLGIEITRRTEVVAA